jgi:hypothetical protein
VAFHYYFFVSVQLRISVSLLILFYLKTAMVKGKVMADALASSRERNITWHQDQTRFILEWCIDYKRKQHLGFKFRKLCA